MRLPHHGIKGLRTIFACRHNKMIHSISCCVSANVREWAERLTGSCLQDFGMGAIGGQ